MLFCTKLFHLDMRVGDKLQLRMGYNQGSSAFLLPYMTKFQFDSPGPVDHYAIGKRQNLTHVRSVSFTLILLPCFCSLKGYCLYIMACLWEPCPSAWMLNQSALFRETSWPCSSVDSYRRKKLTHPLSKAGYSRRYLQGVWHFYYFLTFPLCSMNPIQSQ